MSKITSTTTPFRVGAVGADPFSGQFNFSLNAETGMSNLNYNGRLPEGSSGSKDEIKAAMLQVLRDATAAVEAL